MKTITPTAKNTTRTRFDHNVCDFMNWQGAPNYVEEIHRVETIDPANLEAGWTVNGYQWYYANRGGNCKRSRKIYATVTECEAAYSAWLATW